MTEKRYFVTCEVGDCICELISQRLSDDEFEHLTYHDIADGLNKLTKENEQSKMMIATLRNMVLEQEDLEKENKELKRQVKETIFDINVLIDVSAPNTEKISVLLDLKEKIIETFGEWVIE